MCTVNISSTKIPLHHSALIEHDLHHPKLVQELVPSAVQVLYDLVSSQSKVGPGLDLVINGVIWGPYKQPYNWATGGHFTLLNYKGYNL